jgi:hypothetical protein
MELVENFPMSMMSVSGIIDLMRFPEATRKEWKTACLEELESLQKCSVFKLTDPPKGRKIIGCQWVFDIKSDGWKKA